MADPLGQFVTFERSHDHLPRQQLFEDGPPIADIHHHKIRNSRHKPELHLGKLFLEVSASLIHYTFRLALMRVIVQSRQRARVSDAVNVEWLPRLMKHLDQVGPRHTVADAQTGESVNFRERAQANNVSAFANILE